MWHWRLRRRLTVKSRGRTTTRDRRPGRTLSPGARVAKQTTPHGPLQRLLEGMLPPQPPRRLAWPKYVVQNSTWRIRAGLRGGVEQERAHRHKTTPRRNARHLSQAATMRCNLVRSDAPEPMRPWNDAQGPV